MGRWQFWIDRGGTFTDCLGLDPNRGEVTIAKVLSSDRAPIEGIRALLALPDAEPIPPCDIRMGTTVATNALLERKGTPTALVVSRGFRDLLEIGTQARPHIFSLEIVKPEVLYREVVEIDARASPDGTTLVRPDEQELERELVLLKRKGIRSLAVVVLHAYASPELELLVGEVARRVGFEEISLSHEVAREIGMVGRGDTTTVDAYLTPLIRAYVRGLLAELPGSTLRVMQSSGGLQDARSFRGKNAVLSGPAGGVVAVARVAERSAGSAARAIGFDMGGTSTDVSRYDDGFERVYETEVAGVRLRAPMISIHTVAAGGGSLCRYDGYRFMVGPESAGAFPGPICYGHADAKELAVTDINLALGRILPERFPFPLARDRVERALAELQAKIPSKSIEEIAEGFFAIANANMAEAIRRVSIARGYDVRDYTLVVFGGAGGQHACAIARLLGIRSILFHPYAGVLSAYGMGLADITWDGARDAGRESLSEQTDATLAPIWNELEAEARAALTAEGFGAESIRLVRRLDLRYRGTETSLTIEDEPEERRSRFEALHRRGFGYVRPSHPVEVVVARVEGIARAPGAAHRFVDPACDEPERSGRLFLDGRWLEGIPVVWREALTPGTKREGPLLILEQTGTIVVEPGFSIAIDAEHVLHLTQTRAPPIALDEAKPDPIALEIYNNLYMSIAEQMGVVLRRTALSTNIRERLDFSCAVFDREGGLVANAPHIPVHLGAMSESIRSVLEAHPQPRPGDVFVTNDPTGGGSHLPDITMITPVHGANDELLFFTASRGHHSDVGGITPGSMPPFSKSLAEEGAVLRALKIVSRGELDEAKIMGALTAGPYPARNPKENLADLEAQIAANAAGARLLMRMVEERGLEAVRAYMHHVQDNARMRVEDAIAKLPAGAHRFEDALDDGTPIVVTLTVSGRRMTVDFTGTGAQVGGNLNAPRAVAVSAVMYVLRALVGEPIPLNSGCLAPVEIVVPEKSVLSPDPDRAVCGGNVETSQRVVDVLLGALGRAAASQGTMNNLTFGDATFGYYETIAGGAGATPGYAGASAVHTHMTNTRITDPEVLESRFPVRLIEFSIRRGSGGRGRWPGGDGVVRELEFLKPVRLSILSERRDRPPFGLEGGEPGACGRNLLNGTEVPGKAVLELSAGSRFRVETPGGGGYGKA